VTPARRSSIRRVSEQILNLEDRTGGDRVHQRVAQGEQAIAGDEPRAFVAGAAVSLEGANQTVQPSAVPADLVEVRPIIGSAMLIRLRQHVAAFARLRAIRDRARLVGGSPR
jgi:hypothetical protein